MTTELWVALDVPSESQVDSLVSALAPYVEAFKIGAQLFTAAGPSVVRRVKSHGARVFLDLKYHDIPNTVGSAVAAAAEHGVDYISVHAAGGPAMIAAAAQAARASTTATRPKILAITVLTSLDEESLANDLCVQQPLQEYVVHLARLAQRAGADGVVASPNELRRLRSALGGDFVLVTPGIRPSWSAAHGDQKRIATPQDAARDGATAIVVGRPILSASDASTAARKTLEELQGG